MNRFTQHIPAFVDLDEYPAAIPFETTADLLALEVVQRYASDPRFSHFAMSDNHLMQISDDGFRHWVVGFVAHPNAVDLPKWAGWKHLARLPNGVELVIEPDAQNPVVMACGGQLTLRDGTIATDVLFERQMAKQDADRKLRDHGICPTCMVPFTREERLTDRNQVELRQTCPMCGTRMVSWRPR